MAITESLMLVYLQNNSHVFPLDHVGPNEREITLRQLGNRLAVSRPSSGGGPCPLLENDKADYLAGYLRGRF